MKRIFDVMWVLGGMSTMVIINLTSHALLPLTACALTLKAFEVFLVEE